VGKALAAAPQPEVGAPPYARGGVRIDDDLREK
jgi:hypothetical protein